MGGIKNAGMLIPEDLVRNIILSFLTGVVRGAFLSFQSGINSSSAVVWNTFPERI